MIYLFSCRTNIEFTVALFTQILEALNTVKSAQLTVAGSDVPRVVSGAPEYLQKQLGYPPFPLHHLVGFGAADTLERGALKRA